ncbi:helix-turn-helix domain-containing protein [Flavobacterium limi]|uniref:AraC family transcriptional regulator n=1 Tax=Flavobacterium limi TaxID=2045105 RepID=A0ABQ1UX26_9FLAO|nr:response regulator transcription factor [Flavobacterium limi]GGF29066.1 AraC family transcriptional regulator [Flavobacterium limi]
MHYKKISDLYKSNGYPPPQHPLFGMAVLENSGSPSGKNIDYTSNFYLIGLKRVQSGHMHYGKTTYDYDSGSMFFFKPGQVISIRDVKLEAKGFVLHIHEDLLLGHPLHKNIQEYGYFDYEANEALHLSPREEEIMWELYKKLETEYHNNPDEYTLSIILSHIDSMLNYAQRFYNRQFINRKTISGSIVTAFHNCLKEYFNTGKAQKDGLPNVQQMASILHVSPKYLSDLLKAETGKTAIELIHIHLIREAKNLLKGDEKSISEIAYQLGFENLPYFSRLFKKQTDQTPFNYRKSIN